MSAGSERLPQASTMPASQFARLPRYAKEAILRLERERDDAEARTEMLEGILAKQGEGSEVYVRGDLREANTPLPRMSVIRFELPAQSGMSVPLNYRAQLDAYADRNRGGLTGDLVVRGINCAVAILPSASNTLLVRPVG